MWDSAARVTLVVTRANNPDADASPAGPTLVSDGSRSTTPTE